jgi:UDP-glucose 4-epimerase
VAASSSSRALQAHSGELFCRDRGLRCLVLRTSRFFPESDDLEEFRSSYDNLNTKVNELLYRRVDIEDVVTAHRLALEQAHAVGFGRYVVSATIPSGAPRRSTNRCATGRSPPVP